MFRKKSKERFKVNTVNISNEQGILRALFDGNDISKENITVVDSIMGSGKTTWAIEKVKNSNERFMYITPYNDEIKRVKESLEGIKHLHEPSYENEYGTKRYDFYNYVKDGLDTISTHVLFRNCDREILENIKLHDYTLILDEVMVVVEIKKVSKSDYDMLLETNSISIADGGKVIWLNDNYNGSFDWIKEYAISVQLYKHKSQDTDKVAFLVGNFHMKYLSILKKYIY